MDECKPRATPCEQRLNYTNDAIVTSDVKKYREAVGSLIYLPSCTRPDLSFVVRKLSNYFTGSTEEQWTTVTHAIRNVLHKSPNEKLQLHAYSDADWAADTTDRRSTTGYCVCLNENGPLISWKTKKQPTVARARTHSL